MPAAADQAGTDREAMTGAGCAALALKAEPGIKRDIVLVRHSGTGNPATQTRESRHVSALEESG